MTVYLIVWYLLLFFLFFLLLVHMFPHFVSYSFFLCLRVFLFITSGVWCLSTHSILIKHLRWIHVPFIWRKSGLHRHVKNPPPSSTHLASVSEQWSFSSVHRPPSFISVLGNELTYKSCNSVSVSYISFFISVNSLSNSKVQLCVYLNVYSIQLQKNQ